MSSECPICCSPYNKSTAKCITCPRPDCEQSACKECVKTYLLGSNSDPHCMHCRVGWDHDFLVQNMTASFLKKEYATHRANVLFEREQARIPDTQNEVIKYRRLEDMKQQNINLNRERKALREKLKEMDTEYFARANLIYRIESGEEKIETEKRAFVMPCPEPECKGYLSTAYKCASCSKFACPHCLVVLGEEKDPNHVCDPDVVATIEQIKKETKGCPKCGERIGKVSGCDQMWCPKCQTAFSWRTGNVETGIIHNPHYFQWARQNAPDGVIPRQPGDVPAGGQCGDNINLSGLNMFIRNGVSQETFDVLIHATRYSNHLRNVRINQNRNHIRWYEDTTESRVHFIVGRVHELRFKESLLNRDIQRKQLTDLNNILDLFANAANDIVNNFIVNIREGVEQDVYGNYNYGSHRKCLIKKQLFTTSAVELKKLEDYTNKELIKWAATYGRTVHLVDLDSFQGERITGLRFTKKSAQKAFQIINEQGSKQVK